MSIPFLNPVLLYSVLAGVTAIAAETLYVRWTAPWWHGLWLWTPMQLLIGYCVYRMVTTPGMSLLDAFIVFALSTATLRICMSLFVLHQDIRPGAWAGFGLLILANLLRAYWR